MKRIILFASILAMLGCTSGKGYKGYYFTYDAVDVHESPDESSKVILKATCDWRPRTYDEKTAEIPYAFFLDNKRPVPIGIRKLDETGQWGYINERIPLLYDWHGWVKLSDMIPVGTFDKSEPQPTYQTASGDVTLYKHPGADDNDKLLYWGEGFPTYYYKLEKDDKAQLITREGAWGFVRYIAGARASGKETAVYGWVPMKSLKSVGDIPYDDIKTAFLAAQHEKEIAKSKDRGKLFQWGAEHWSSLRPKLCKAYNGGAVAALIIALVCFYPAFRRKRLLGDVVMLPVFAVYLFVMGSMSGGPGIMYGLAAPVLAATVLYPLLYLRFSSRIVGPLIRIAGIAGSLYIMLFAEVFASQPLLLHLILFLVYGTATVWFSRFIAKKLEDDVCPNCGFYAGHAKLGEEYLGTTSKTEHSSRDVFDHSSTSGNVTTNYYRRETSSVTTHTDHYSVDRRCARCGYTFDNEKTRTRKEYH